MTRAAPGLGLVRWTYFSLLVALSMAIVLASFVRERAQLASDISFWFFCGTFLVSLLSLRVGLVLAVLLLTISPGLHHQLNSLLGTSLNAWAYAGVDCLIGYVAAWAIRGGLGHARPLVDRFPMPAVLVLHLWIAVSAVVAVARNVWQSASELTLRGVAYNVWITRGLSFQDDYLPIQDLFFISIAIVVLVSVWSQLRRDGEGLLRSLIMAVMTGASANAAFGAWQKASGKGWFAGSPADINAFWPDIHSFAALMVVALALGIGTLVARRPGAREKSLIVLGSFFAMAGLYVSGSRSTFLIVLLAVVGIGLWAALFVLRGWQRVVPLVLVAVLAAVAGALFSVGFRGVSISTVAAAFDSGNVSAIDAALSHRPAIWRAALGMYSDFPFFGLGQGGFQRQSSIAEFSRSDVLVGMGGGGAHNYFLHTWVELGAVGVVLLVVIALPFVRLRSANYRFVGFFALAGVAVGNIYGHALLVREMLMLGAVLTGVYLWEVQTVGPVRLKLPSGRFFRTAAILLVVLALAAVVEVITSFTRMPFAYGQRCFEEHPLDADRWTRGVVSVPVPPAATRARITVEPAGIDVSRRTLTVVMGVVGDLAGQPRAERLEFAKGDSRARVVDLDLGEARGARFVKLRVSHCFVPLDLGYSLEGKHETRRLGVKVPELFFVSREGAEFRY